jgi:hypothetical protein
MLGILSSAGRLARASGPSWDRMMSFTLLALQNSCSQQHAHVAMHAAGGITGRQLRVRARLLANWPGLGAAVWRSNWHADVTHLSHISPEARPHKPLVVEHLAGLC